MQRPPQPPPPKPGTLYLLPEALRAHLVQYLVQRPWVEVNETIQALAVLPVAQVVADAHQPATAATAANGAADNTNANANVS